MLTVDTDLLQTHCPTNELQARCSVHHTPNLARKEHADRGRCETNQGGRSEGITVRIDDCRQLLVPAWDVWGLAEDERCKLVEVRE